MIDLDELGRMWRAAQPTLGEVVSGKWSADKDDFIRYAVTYMAMPHIVAELRAARAVVAAYKDMMDGANDCRHWVVEDAVEAYDEIVKTTMGERTECSKS